MVDPKQVELNSTMNVELRRGITMDKAVIGSAHLFALGYTGACKKYLVFAVPFLKLGV